MKIIVLTLLTSVLLVSSGCAAPGDKTAKGSLAGGALGAGLGAIVGNQTGHAGRGVAIGAGIGALAGAAVGQGLDQQDESNDRIRGQVEQNQALIDENKRLIAELRKRGADVRNTERGVVINLPDILFDFDKARLTKEARRTVSEIGEVVATVDHRNISIEGHTDSIGSISYNKDLSLKRARAVAQELEYEGVDRAQMRVVGFGEGKPIATNNTEIGRSRNRRVEVIVEN